MLYLQNNPQILTILNNSFFFSQLDHKVQFGHKFSSAIVPGETVVQVASFCSSTI